MLSIVLSILRSSFTVCIGKRLIVVNESIRNYCDRLVKTDLVRNRRSVGELRCVRGWNIWTRMGGSLANVELTSGVTIEA